MRRISAEELSKILEEHEKWLRTDKEEGKRADLREADLRGVDLNGASLRDADLRGIDMSGTDLNGTYLGGADLSGANLERVSGLTVEQLSKAKTLSRAELDPVLMKLVKNKIDAGDASMFQLLHFSDTHNNSRATNALLNVAERFPDAYIVITGDICSEVTPVADERLGQLPNPRVWIVPGNHDMSDDMPVHERLGHLKSESVYWRTPFVDSVANVRVLGITTDGPGSVSDDLSTVPKASVSEELTASLLLCHHPITDERLSDLLSWLVPESQTVPLIVCHGHEHYDRAFFAKNYLKELGGVNVHVSKVYSANTNSNGSLLGAANLIDVKLNSNVEIKAVCQLD
jgi:calcineurin-like phosphoesterase family protein